jgi:hypothetical protein
LLEIRTHHFHTKKCPKRVTSDLGEKIAKSAKRRKEKIEANKASMTNLRGYTPDVQKVKQVKEGVSEDMENMKKLWNYHKNTQ